MQKSNPIFKNFIITITLEIRGKLYGQLIINRKEKRKKIGTSINGVANSHHCDIANT